MKVVIAGSRDFENYHLVEEAVIRSHFDVSVVLSGGARGIDRLGIAFARNHNFQAQIFVPEWKRFGKSAGMIRNRQMATAADAVIAIWDGKSKGTRNMIELASKLRLPCFVLLINCDKSFDPQINGVTFARR